MRDIMFVQINSVPFMMFLMTILSVLKVIGSAAVIMLLFNIQPTKNKIRYILAALVTVAFSIASTYMMEGSCFGKYDYFNTFIPMLCVFFMDFSGVKDFLKCCVGAFGFDAISSVKIIILMALGMDSDGIAEHSAEFMPELATDFVLVVLSVGLIVFSKKRKTISFMGKINAPLYILISVTLMIFLISMIVLGVDYTRNYRQFILIFMNMPLISVTVGYAMRIFVRSKNNEEKFREMLEIQIRHYEEMEKKNEKLKIFRHDFPKIMKPVILNVRQGNSDEVEKLLEQLNITVKSSRPSYQSGNISLDTVLECACQRAAKNDITVTLGNGSVFPADGIDVRDIYTIFPNALDNAIEACEKNGGHSDILFESRIKANSVYVKISNPFSGTLSHTSEGLKTTKADTDSHGYGTRSIKKAASKYGKDNVTFAAQNGVFTISIRLDF